MCFIYLSSKDYPHLSPPTASLFLSSLDRSPMAAATGHLPFLIFLLFLASSSLHTTHARLPSLFHKMAHFNVATEDTQDLSIPQQEEDIYRPFASASQDPNRGIGGGLYGPSDPEKNSRSTTSTNYNADAYELYDEDPLKGSPIGTNYHGEAATEKKPPLPFYGTSGSSEKHKLPRYQAKETYDNADNQYSYGMSDTRSLENGRYNYEDINEDEARESRGRGYGDPSTTSTHSYYSYDSNEDAFGYATANSMERYQQEEEEEEQGEPRDGFTP